MANFPPVIATSKIGRAYEVLNDFHGGATTDDTVSVRLIMQAISTEYQGVLQDYLDKTLNLGLNIDDQLYEEYSCLPLVSAAEDCDCGTVKCGVKKVSLPKFAVYYGSPAIGFFGTNEGLSFTKASSLSDARNKVKVKPYAGPSKPAYYLSGQTAFVVLPALYKQLCSVTITGIPQDPSESLTGSCSDIWTDDYIKAGHLWAETKRRVLGKDAALLLSSQMMRDLINNANPGNTIATK